MPGKTVTEDGIPMPGKTVTEAMKIRLKHPQHLPVVCVKIQAPSERIQNGKLLMPRSMTGAQMKETVHYRLPWSKTARILVGGLTVPDTVSLSDLDKEHQAEDGYLYVTIDDQKEPSAQAPPGQSDCKSRTAGANISRCTDRRSDDAPVRGVLAKFPDRVPLICRQPAGPELPAIDKKLLIPPAMTVSEVRVVIAKNFPKASNVDPERLIVTIGGTNPKADDAMVELYERHQSDDGILYVTLALDSPASPSSPAEEKRAEARRNELEEEVASQEKQVVAAEAFRKQLEEEVAFQAKMVASAEEARAHLEEEVAKQAKRAAVAEEARARLEEEVAFQAKRAAIAEEARAQLEEEVAKQAKRAAVAEEARARLEEEVAFQAKRAAIAEEAARARLEEEVPSQEAARARLEEEVPSQAEEAITSSATRNGTLQADAVSASAVDKEDEADGFFHIDVADACDVAEDGFYRV
eukprot:TRINITY_DN5887_c0_g1_i1.p1 TRINITY_DN5887_c0_g1~~TRINITY_DN5887_c0_g1_i1.p1  ORF type:complete len:523 (-),score=125.19 TRINITY_DN5887_c0_g1_i1:239-1639(-)